jgi:hypothetical protein
MGAARLTGRPPSFCERHFPEPRRLQGKTTEFQLRMRVNRIHRLIGIVLLVPIVGWAVTGLVFFVKPGYSGAYESLNFRTYPLDRAAAVSAEAAWTEYRYFRTVLGDHLVARTGLGWVHLDPLTLQPAPTPTDAEIRRLLVDAFSANPRRYGTITGMTGGVVHTDTGIEITVDWQQMTLRQRGSDTDLIDLLYRVHYLQWTGMPIIDNALGFVGLAFLMGLAVLGARLAIRKH